MINVNLASLTPEEWIGLDNRTKNTYVASALGWKPVPGSGGNSDMWEDKDGQHRFTWSIYGSYEAGLWNACDWNGFGCLVEECARRGWRLEFEELSFREAEYWRCSIHFQDGYTIDTETERESYHRLSH